jgi:hypothetical protein
MYYNEELFFPPQAKALEELDAEFGVGELVEDEMRNERRVAYSSRDLRGLRVEHAVVSIMFMQLFLLSV